MKKYRFHILGLAHAKTTKEYACEAFTQKVRLFCKMMTERGHIVYHYGTEGSNPICTEHISVLSLDTFNLVHGTYDYKKDGFIKTNNENPASIEFINNSILEMNKRKQLDDFLICSYGIGHKPVADGVKDMIVVELGIGYSNSFAPYRIFESYSWMHYTYGKEGKLNGINNYDAVIPNYYDLDDYVFEEEKDDYYFFIARPITEKGLNVAIKTVEKLGGKLIVAGQGNPPYESKCMKFVGVVSIEERAKLMSKAKAVFVPTLYPEPFGSVVIESLMCGTPVITTDYGAFPETVIHGKVGYRCRTLEQFIWAAKNIENIKPKNCRQWAESNYSIERVSKMYEEYFDMLNRLFTNNESWFQENDSRIELDWLVKINI